MHPRRMLRLLTLASALAWLPLAAGSAAEERHADWPCTQELVPRLSLAQVWRGPLPADTGQWAADREIAPLARALASRSLPIEEARKRIEQFAAKLPPETRREKLQLLMQALLKTIDGGRRRIIRRIEAYARNQKRLVDHIVEDTQALEDGKIAADRRAEVTNRRDWNLRIFEDRRKMLKTVCEQPDLMEKRLFALARTIARLLEEKHS